MIVFIILAVGAGLLVGLSRQLNGRLALSTNAWESSFWNHIVGLGFVSLIAVIGGGMFAGEPMNAPWWAFLGGPIGVLFIAAGSWAINRIGAAQTAMLIIAGQMISGVFLDLVMNVPGQLWARIAGVALILGGIWVTRTAKDKR